MGVSGCGKSTLGIALAQELGWSFVEGDSQHSAQNVAKMASGQPLNDDDRAGWLLRLSGLLSRAHEQDQGLVISCSALKRSYRDILRQGDAGVLFVHLQGDADLIASRMADRAGHYMPASLLQSQFADLQLPDADEAVLTLGIALAPQEQILGVMNHFKQREALGA
jgi:gluconokinase